ncbi:unnamed protein product [Darwinula stevensoni]|uniref:Oplophorus-luciferin 2-monooxygenase non-catalytic subunit n=1 Tax=Darwinula stevensoni TaxID=69355 RepID=A0A7R9FS11_9CRUS|nr:unnamed protein product [Darwinula stevensoni]CAG0902817.1 unnamed protein product [Darwinula stevensoni]
MQEYLTPLSLFIILYSFPGTGGQSPCPDPEAIIPCVCSHNETLATVTVDCSEATSSEEIFSAFNDADWPILNLTSFWLERNDRVEQLPEGVFGDVTFQEIEVSRTSVESIDPEALLPSKDRLERLDINNSKLKEFPFEIIAQFSILTYLSLGANELTSLSSFQSSSLETLGVAGNQLTFFGNMSLPNLRSFLMSFSSHLNLHLRKNEIAVVNEESFRPILEVISNVTGNIDLTDNPVVCNCTMAWIVLNPAFLTKVTGSCTDGTDFQDLDPIDFQNCVDRIP